MRKVLFAFCALIFLMINQVMAQDRTITGKVTAKDNGEGLPAVNIVVKGTTQGTVTDVEGNYRISVKQDAKTLVFSFTGYRSQDVEIGNRSTIDVALEQADVSLNEVVVVGYGTQQKIDLTGSIASVSAKEIQNVPVQTFEAAIQGRTAGVQVESGSGKVGQGMKIRVRGSASVTASNQPLYVVDGMPITSENVGDPNDEPLNPLADINPNDIESIEVLKDAAASAIYGARAANGVVLITTKRGKAGRTNFNFGASTGWSTPTRMKEFLNTKQYLELFREAAVNAGLSESEIEEEFDFSIPGWRDSAEVDVDWQKLAFQKAPYRQYDLSASGGNEKTRFYAGGTYTNQKGIILGNAFDRISGRLTLDHNATSKLKFGGTLSLTHSFNKRVPEDNAFSNPLQLVAMPPVQRAYNPDGTANRNTLYYNNLIEQGEAFFHAKTIRTLSNVYGSYDFIPGLTFRTEYGVDILNLVEEKYRSALTQDGSPFGGYGTYRTTQVINYNTNNTLNFTRKINDVHNLEVLVGMSYQDSRTSSSIAETGGFPSNDFKKLVSGANPLTAQSSGTGYTFTSYFSRLNYKFGSKYLVSLSARTDGSSRFGANNRYGFFPAASAGWILSEEAFLKGVQTISLLKLRASYGATGNSEIDNFASRGLFRAIPYADKAGLRTFRLASPDLKWETTYQLDVAVDFGFANNRISGTLDFYQKNTKDLLLELNVPATTGFTTQYKNIGKLNNKGVEFTLNTENFVGEFRWTTSFNIARNVNKVTDLVGSVVTPTSGRFLNQAREGYPIGVFFGAKYAGVDPETGDALYYDKDGKTTNVFANAHRQVIGDPTPDFVGGLNNTFSYKGFDASVLMQFVYGNDVFNMAGIFQSVNASQGYGFDNQTTDQMNRWRKPGDKTNVPKANLGKRDDNASSRWLSDGSYLRVKTVSIGYTVPQTWTRKIYVERARVFMTAQNLFTFTKYDGWDPEVNTQGIGNIAQGSDFYTPPQAKTITFGVNIGF